LWPAMISLAAWTSYGGGAASQVWHQDGLRPLPTPRFRLASLGPGDWRQPNGRNFATSGVEAEPAEADGFSKNNISESVQSGLFRGCDCRAEGVAAGHTARESRKVARTNPIASTTRAAARF